MAARTKDLPETMTSPETGEVLRRDVRPFTVRYKGMERTVEASGYYPERGEGDGVFVGDDMEPMEKALREMKEVADGLPAPATIREIRKKLKLTQREAGALFKVGDKAFDKYERGLVQPSGPTVQLLNLLRKHPELVRELK